jgi:hypothetical protein
MAVSLSRVIEKLVRFTAVCSRKTAGASPIHLDWSLSADNIVSLAKELVSHSRTQYDLVSSTLVDFLMKSGCGFERNSFLGKDHGTHDRR